MEQTTQRNVYFGKDHRDQIALRKMKELEETGIDCRELFKEMLVQLQRGSIKVDRDTLQIEAGDLHGMVSTILDLMNSGKLMMSTHPGQQVIPEGAAEIVVNEKVLRAFTMED